VNRIPVASRIAFATAASGGTIGTSPTPRTPCQVQRVRDLDDHGLDHRQIRRDRHPIVEEARVLHHAVGQYVCFVQGPSDALRSAALHLSFDIARMCALPTSWNTV
jgi:hypothetical protein